MTPLPNIKLMDALVFTASFLFGFEVGVGVSTLSWLVYGFVNLYGHAGPILVFLIIGESFYAVEGSILRRSRFANRLLQEQVPPSGFSLESNGVLGALSKVGKLGILFGFTGLLGALAYDVFTNTATWFQMLYGPGRNFVGLLGQSFYVGLLTMNFPLPMGLMHQISDLFFFATVVPLAARIPGRLGWVSTQETRGE